MNLFVLIIGMMLSGNLEVGVKTTDGDKIMVFKTRAACEEELVKLKKELGEVLDVPFEVLCITQKEYNKLIKEPENKV